jgi:hypothetical protein
VILETDIKDVGGMHFLFLQPSITSSKHHEVQNIINFSDHIVIQSYAKPPHHKIFYEGLIPYLNKSVLS